MSKIRSIISAIDRDYLNDFFHRIYNNILCKDFFHGSKSIVLCEPLSDMVLMQTDRHENRFDMFCAYDFAVRLLAIENYYGINDFGFELYKKMHMRGGNYGQINEQEAFYEAQRVKEVPTHKALSYSNQRTEQHSVEQFVKLIQSVEKKGFMTDSFVIGDKNLLSINGSHRIALALYTRQEMINVEVYKRLTSRRFSIDFFWEKGFTSEEISVIKNKTEEIVSTCKQNIGNYYCILFPPAERYFDNIVKDISLIAPENIQILEVNDYCWETADFVGLLTGVYHFDSINHANFLRKMFYIMRASNISDGKVNFRIVSLNINNPMYRLKKDNGMPESVATVYLKKMIRERYKPMESAFSEHYLGDYPHDVIIHSSDNYFSNKAFRTLMNVDRDMSDIVSVLHNYQYAFAIGSEDKLSRYYPHNFYFGEDFDVFVLQNDVSIIAEKLFLGCKGKFEPYGFEVKNEDSPYGKRVRVLFDTFTVTMFDLMTKMTYLSDKSVKRFIDGSKGENVPSIGRDEEYAYRLVKLLLNPHKEYHKKYLVTNKNSVNLEIVFSYFNSNGLHKANGLINKLEAE